MNFSKVYKWVLCVSLPFLIFFTSGLRSSNGEIATESDQSVDLVSIDVITELKLGDCTACHEKIVKQVEENGGAHKVEVSCIDCHTGHPPAEWNIIPDCSDCHSGKLHFTLPACLGCHTNPHTPLILFLSKDITEPCLACHEEQNRQLQEHKSIHSVLDCTACHYSHGQIPDCLRCHAFHAETAIPEKCNDCHPAHKPLIVSYGPEIFSDTCIACHREKAALLYTSKTKHSALPCAKCHQLKHKMIPACEMCHGQRHSEWIMNKFSDCAECHAIAHNLSPVSKEGERQKTDREETEKH